MIYPLNLLRSGALPLLTCILLSACGGGGTTAGDGDVTWALNPAGVVTYAPVSTNFQGTISGLGSIVVNGVRFETTDASIYDPDSFDDSTLFGSDLSMGMTVALMGDADESQNLGRASRIRVVGGVRGTLMPSVNMDTVQKTLVFPTQTVTYTDATLFSGTVDGTSITSATQLAALTGSVLLNVYGLPQADNSFLATRVVLIDPLTHALDVAVRGKITAVLGSGKYTLATGALTSITVDCSTCVVQPAGNTPAVNDVVRVLATDSNSFKEGILTGLRLQLVDAVRLARFNGVTNGFTKIKGVATQIDNVWYVADVQVKGVTNLVAGVFYEVKGTWSGSTLIATVAEQEGHDSSVDSSGNSHTYSNELYGAVAQLSGSRFSVQGVLVDASSAFFKSGSLLSLANGQFVEIKGSLGTNGVLIATQVEVKYPSGSSDGGQGRYFEIKGVVSNWNGTGTTFSVTDRNGAILTAITSPSTRFNHGLPSSGVRVELKGYLNTAGIYEVVKLEVKNNNDGHNDE